MQNSLESRPGAGSRFLGNQYRSILKKTLSEIFKEETHKQQMEEILKSEEHTKAEPSQSPTKGM